MNLLLKPVLAFLLACLPMLTMVYGQRINRFSTNEMELIYFGNRYSYLMPHVAGTFHNALEFHKKHWDYAHNRTYVLLTDFEDNGHGGAIVMPENMVIIGISPFNYAFSIIPSNERFQWLSSHELTHVTLADRANSKDLFWRRFFLGKVRRDEKNPITALWSYLTTPRWYAPRWFHEGIACYLETWMSGGLGRSLGPYDEMYFRSIINENESLYSVVGLETEGTTIDFQVGANAYLYGTRFVNYLSATYGENKLISLYKRTDDSKAFYASQFKNVYGKSVKESWQDWIDFETSFQQKNLDLLNQYPITPFSPITAEPLGSCSNYAYNSQTQKVYAAINRPGAISQIIELDVPTGKIRKISSLDSPVLYTVTFLAYDAEKGQLFISEQNSKYRSLVSIDIASGRKVTKIPFSRTGNLVFNPVDRSLWGIRHDNGYASLVKIPEPYTEHIPMFTADFGRSILDPAISNDGKRIVLTSTGVRGEQSLIMFEIADLEIGIRKFETVFELEDNTLNQFKFSLDDQYLIGTSYYTGVSNIWRIGLEDKIFELLSNDENGLFQPLQLKNDSLLVLRFYRNGMLPGMIPHQVIHSANAIDYAGNMVYERNPQIEAYSLPPANRINLDSLKLAEEAYYPLKNMRLTSAYPDVAGFKKTAVVGYRLNWRDQIGLSTANLFIAGSPWSSYHDKQKFHAELNLNYWTWGFHASLNTSDFYDLFGPTKRSRAGYSIGISNKKSMTIRAPFRWQYGFNINHYGDLEVLPEFQNIASPIRSLQSVSGDIGVSKLRRSLGGEGDEMGYSWNILGYSYIVKGSIYPSLISEQHVGWLVPGLRNTSFWIRNSAGQSFGKRDAPYSSFYFGSFRNNYVDWQAPEQYRKVLAFPGVDIDALQAHNFIKTMADLNIRPLRLRDLGATWLYPTFLKSAVFGTHMLLNPDYSSETRNVFNAGVQFDLELVLFSYLKTTWSVGYARKFEEGLGPSEQWMFSLKLLGN